MNCMLLLWFILSVFLSAECWYFNFLKVYIMGVLCFGFFLHHAFASIMPLNLYDVSKMCIYHLYNNLLVNDSEMNFSIVKPDCNPTKPIARVCLLCVSFLSTYGIYLLVIWGEMYIVLIALLYVGCLYMLWIHSESYFCLDWVIVNIISCCHKHG